MRWFRSTVTEPVVAAAESSTDPGAATVSETAVAADATTAIAPVAEKLRSDGLPLQVQHLRGHHPR